VTPTVDSLWATPSLNIVSPYPAAKEISPGNYYSPPMIPYTTINANQQIKWLDKDIYDEADSFGDTSSFVFDYRNSFAKDKYDDLGTFYNQKVTYSTKQADHSNKRAGANVFCKGKFEVLHGSSTIGSPSELPTINNKQITLSSTGTHQISTQLKGVECLGAIVKHPLNTVDDSATPDVDDREFFRVYYFTTNQPSIPSTSAVKTVSLTVVDSGGNFDMEAVDIEADKSPSDSDLTMVLIKAKNNGDQAKVTSVTGNNAGYTVLKFPDKTTCQNTLGFGSLCPDPNGFDIPINSGATKDLYVLIKKNAGASGGITLTLCGETTSGVCGGSDSDCFTADLTGAVYCEIEPPQLDICTMNWATWEVSCEDLAGDPISCPGNNWYWDGLNGEFFVKTNTYTEAYPTSPPGSSGTLNYESGMANCKSDINVVKTDCYECEFIPGSANMETGDSKYFKLNCFYKDAPSTPDDADYDLIDGLLGSTDNSSTAGTAFTAGADSEGKLRGKAGWNNPADDPIGGGVAYANIKVGNGSSIPNGGGGGDDGSNEHCTIGTGALNVYPGSTGYVPLKCGPNADQPCSNVTWIEDGYVHLDESTDSGSRYEITGTAGDKGRIWACVDNSATKCCYRGFTIQTADCWEYS
jgi:hypothetical protein